LAVWLASNDRHQLITKSHGAFWRTEAALDAGRAMVNWVWWMHCLAVVCRRHYVTQSRGRPRFV